MTTDQRTADGWTFVGFAVRLKGADRWAENGYGAPCSRRTRRAFVTHFEAMLAASTFKPSDDPRIVLVWARSVKAVKP